ncbi:benzoate/H(+) symporter BenE family transporter [Denitrobaculum tricleocarpae]|uniref:Benzoate/H(+) symporter BenE family transporter n=2 Tax=Denitrobaculum tricleocarpae TaxID=2591009 RepID=A0A545TYX1_9PROT|nr:benzoate/H(+) symporter BenE family transporter [Denitrobaculum tricleocarpae]
MRSSHVISALVAILVGFGSSVAVILAAARAVGATPDQTSSWVAALCLAIAATTAVLSLRHRMPIVTAWSTPGAALIATTQGVNIEQAVGAFLLAAVLIIATAAFRPINALMARIPTAIAAAMLAGVLFGFVLSLFDHLEASPALVLPLLAVFVTFRLFSAAWAVLVVLVAGVALSYGLDLTRPIGDLALSRFIYVHPVFDPVTLIGLGLPLYIVTMASQNLPGFAVLKASDYHPPSRSILGVTGLASLLTAPVGAHATNLAAITASLCTGPDVDPDKDRRWLCGPFYALGYALLAVFGASLVTLFASFPEALIATVAGVALASPFMASLSASVSEERDRFAALTTFAVTASGFSAFGLGAAMWGLFAGLLAFGLERLKAQH